MTYELAILQLVQTKGLGVSTLRKLLVRVNGDLDELQALVQSDPNDLVRDYELSEPVATAIEAAREEAASIAVELRKHAVEILFLGTASYPEKLTQTLGGKAPPVLFARGNLAILERPAIAFSGSRKASQTGLNIARDSVAPLAEAGINIISGYAQGVDVAVHHAAMDAGGVTTTVLAEGILQFKRKAEIAELITSENFLVISEFPPRLRWIARNAMQRNLTICGLSNALIVIEAGLTGGTIAAGEAALEIRMPVFAVKFGNPPESALGNAKLIKLGANAIVRNQEGKPSLQQVVQTLESNEPTSSLERGENLAPNVQQLMFSIPPIK